MQVGFVMFIVLIMKTRWILAYKMILSFKFLDPPPIPYRMVFITTTINVVCDWENDFGIIISW